MNNINNPAEKGEKVEVRIPCQPLYFRKRGEDEVEITETISERIKFVGNSARHIFECVIGKSNCRLEFDTSSLAWTLFEG